MRTMTAVAVGLCLILALAGSIDAVDPLFETRRVYQVGGRPTSVFAADFDGDSDPDLAIANEASDNVSILINYGNGSYARAVDYGVESQPAAVFAADFDGDLDFDLAVANSLSASVSILFNDGLGVFSSSSPVTVGQHPVSVFAADLDGDSDYDLAVANRGSDDVAVLVNDGSGSFVAAPDRPGVGESPSCIFAADLTETVILTWS